MSNENDLQTQVSDWIQRNKTWIISSILLLIAILGANDYYSKQQKNKRYELSALYQQWEKAQISNQQELATKLANEMRNSYSSYPLTHLVMSVEAKRELDSGRPIKAKKIYQDILSICQKPYCDMIELRLARIYYKNNEFDLAKSTLNKIEDNSYQDLKNILLGDILSKQGKLEDAQKIWLETYQLINIEESPEKVGIKSQLTYRLQKVYEIQQQKDSDNRPT